MNQRISRNILMTRRARAWHLKSVWKIIVAVVTKVDPDVIGPPAGAVIKV